MDDTLSIGDSVCLYSEESNGFVLASQSSTVHSEVAVGARQDRVQPPVVDQHIVTFEICVANRYKLDKKYRKLKAKSDDAQDDVLLKNTVAQAKIAANAEAEDNAFEQKRQQGKKVLYGQVIQMRHLFTRKYIHVSTTQTSNTESNNMAVNLFEHNAKHAQFRIMPRYKVKAEGDVVQIDDQLVLESVKSPGQFLHVSRQLLGKQSVYSQCNEMNLSVRQSGFTVYRKHKPCHDDEAKLKVGDLIRFYHKEMEAYLVAEGLFDDQLTEDVHLRVRPVDQSNPKTMFPSSSAVTYWQIELEEGPISGGVLKWGQQCRIIHVCTRKYLTVDTKGKVSLTSNYLDSGTVFRLHAVIRDSDDIPYESYTRIEHVVTGHWLHALADEYLKQNDTQQSDSQDMSMAGLKYSSAQLKKIEAIAEKQYDDAFTIQVVTEDLVEIFHYMAGMVPFIQKLVNDKKDDVKLNAKMAHVIITALQEMKNFMIVNSVPNKNRQKLMRNLRIVELLVSLLRIPYRGSADQLHLTKIFVEAYDVLYTYLMGNSRKNELYIAKYIDFFLTQFEYKEEIPLPIPVITLHLPSRSESLDGNNNPQEGDIGLNAAHMIMELIRDNRKIVDRISNQNINDFVDLLHRNKNYRYLDLLSVLCVCDGVSISDNQNYITEVWLMSQNKNCYLTDLGQKIGKVKDTVYVSTNNGKRWEELREFANRSEHDDEYLFLEHQLELFGMLCHGQNEFAIEVITQKLDYLTWNEAFTCLCDKSLPDRLRAKYCELIIIMFVDIGNNVSVVDRVKLSYIYDDIDQSEDLLDKTSSPTYQYFPALRDWISLFLKTNGDMTASEIGNNMLVQQVLHLVHCLVKYGFFHQSSDIKILLEPLMSLLDGRNDKPYPNIQSKEGEEVLKYFRKTGRFQKSPETKAIVDAKIQALEVLNLFFNFIFNLRMEKFMNMFKTTHSQATRPNMPPPELGILLNETFQLIDNPGVCRTALRRLNEIWEETSFFKNYDMTEILLDLSNYEYDEMVCRSMYLLNRYFSAHHNLFSRAVQAQVLITDKCVAVVNDLKTMLPRLRRLATAKLNTDQVDEFTNIMTELVKFSHLEGEPEENHMMNQCILYNHGILEDCFTILSQEIDVKLLDQYSGMRQVLRKTFLLLQAMARNNKQVQGRLFDRLELLLSKEGAPHELADAITEVFTGNSNTCMKVQGHQVQKVMSLVAEHGAKVPQFLDLLSAIVKVEELDLPLKRNQSYVMTYFMQYRAEIAGIIDQPEQERERILTGRDSEELNYLIAMVDLLATCAEGENRFIESICQTIFKIPELLKILNNSSVNNNLKRPFLRFLLWVYMNTASGMIDSGAGDLPHDGMLYSYMDSLNLELDRVTQFVKAKPDITKQLLKRPPIKRSTNNPKSSYGDRGSSEQESVRGTLHYLFDGVMPFLQIFCRSYYQPDETMFPGEIAALSKLTMTLESFLEAVAPLISMERQMKLVVGAMTAMMTASSAMSTAKMQEFHEKYGGGVGSQDVRSDARKKYEEYFANEEEINDKLNVFANNMHLAYGGMNDVHTQIGFNSKEPYTEVGGDEDLPLGSEFQNHLKCFINPSAKKAVDRYKMAEKLVQQLGISANLTNLSEKNRLDQAELDIKCLQLLRGLIHNETVKLPENWEVNIKACKKQLKMIEDVQVALNSYGAILSTLNHLSRPEDNIIRELLAFLSKLLFGGNVEVQNSIFGYFTGTREETFFFAIKTRMQLSALATREKRLLHAMHVAKVEEVIAQAKALQKAMKEGNMAGIDMLMAGQLGSMLSMAKKSRISLRPSDLKRNKMGSRGSFGRTGKLGGGGGGGAGGLMVPQLVPPTLAVNGSFVSMNRKSHDIKPIQNKVAPLSKGKKTAEVAPLDEVEIKIEELDEEELAELTNMAVSMSEDLDFKDDGYIELVLRVLGLMCDNQHCGLQNYLREQPDNIKSVNLVAETTRFLNILYSSVTEKTIPLIIQLFDTLVEYTSGNFQNQAIVFENKICEYANHILRAGHFKGCSQEDVYSLKKSIAILIRSLTEENVPETKDEDIVLATEVLEYIDSDALVSVMTTAYSDMQHSKNGDSLISDVGFQYYQLLCRKIDLSSHTTTETLIKTPEIEQAWQYFAEYTLSIEIIKDDVLQKIYFRVKDKNVLREEIKEKFKYEVDRSSPSNKLRDFMDWSNDIIDDIKYQRKLHANPLSRFFVQAWWLINTLVLLVTLAITILVLVTWTENTAIITDPIPVQSAWPGAVTAMYVLGGLHNVLCLFILISYFLSNHPLLPGFQDVANCFRSIKPGKPNQGDVDDEDDDKKTGGHLNVNFFGFLTFYYIFFLGFSVCGTAFYGYFFSLHLMHMAMMNQLLKRVIQAVTRNGWSLILVGLFSLAIMYIFSLAAFAFFREILDSNEGRQCRTAYECLTTMIHHGLVEGIYSTFEQKLTGKSYLYTLGVAAFDTIFFIVITTISLNIIFGIIVDTFSELRDSKWQIDNDMKTTCFICSRESYDFERQAGGFERHVKQEHNQWAYLFFFIHLDETRPNDYSALELHVFNLLKRDNFDFFPLNRALSLQHEEDSSEKKLEMLTNQVNYLVTKMKEEEAQKEREKERKRQMEWEAKHKTLKK